MGKLNVRAFGLACGIVWGSAMFFLGLMSMGCSLGSAIQHGMASLYIGYKPTVLGSIIGGIWGFLDAGIGGLAIAWLYNKMAK